MSEQPEPYGPVSRNQGVRGGRMEWPNPIDLYREFSDEMYAAGFMGMPEEDKGLQDEFAEWFRSKFGHRECDLGDADLQSLPVLWRIVGEVVFGIPEGVLPPLGEGGVHFGPPDPDGFTFGEVLGGERREEVAP